jgi:hypothetical protein
MDSEGGMKVRFALSTLLFAFAAACAQFPAWPGRSETPAPAAQPAQEFLPDGGPPVVNGFYDAVGSCPFEGCGAGDVYMTGPVALLERSAPGARVVATIPAGEWAFVANTVSRYRPARGVVVGEVANVSSYGDVQPVLHIGDVVYAIDYEGEGQSTLWRRGDRMTWSDTGDRDSNGVTDGIRWDPSSQEQWAADEAAGAGWWLELTRANGERGWVRDLSNVDCLGAIDAPPHCGTRPAGQR